MSDLDPTYEADPSPDEARPTQAPTTDPAASFDSLQTTPPPPSIPETRFEVADSLLTSPPTDTYATAHPDSPPTSHREPAPEAFPGYEILETLGEGGMGIVYQARQVGLNRLVALKVVLKGRRAGPKDLIRFLAEAEAIASIKHPHVVQVHEYGEAEGRPFLAMEYLPGGTLADRLKSEGRIAPKPAAELLAKLARAVQAAHDQGIVHRDLKPANILFDAEGEPKVTDFGLAKRIKGQDLTHTQAVMGTPAYMSPEQAKGQTKFVGPPADVYALGVILYECLTGARPFHHEDAHVLLYQVIADDPKPPSHHIPDLSRDLELITLKCLSKNPDERYPTTHSLAADLARFAAGEPISIRPANSFERALKWAKRKPTQAATCVLSATVAALLLFGASLIVLWQKAERDKAIAEVAKLNADIARDGEQKARTLAEGAQAAEKKLRSEVEAAREKLTRVEYGRTMEIAHQEWKNNDRAASVALLDGTRADLRGWEWKYLQRLWNHELLKLKGHVSSVMTVTWSPDGSYLATGSQDGTARVWDARTGSTLSSFKVPEDYWVKSVSWSPDSTRIALVWLLSPGARGGGPDQAVRIWGARSGIEVFSLEEPASQIGSISWSPDGSRILTGSGGSVRVWNATNGARQFTLRGMNSSPSWSPDGSRIATRGSQKTIRVWDAVDGDEKLTLLGDADTSGGPLWSPDGSRITANNDHAPQVWDSRSGAQLLTLNGHDGRVISVSWSPDSSRIATTGSDLTARVWDSQSGIQLHNFNGHTSLIYELAWSPDGFSIATASYDRTTRIWDTRKGAEVLQIKGHSASVNGLSWSPDGSRIATASHDKTTRIWDSHQSAELLTFETDSEILSCVSWSPDGSRIATDSLGHAGRVRDARTGADILQLKGHTGHILHATWSPDGSRIATAGADKTARIWDASNGMELRTLEGHASAVWSVAWSPDGSRIATAGADKTARIWDASNGMELRTLEGHASAVWSVTWSPDGSRIATSSDDKTARIWDGASGAELLTLKGHTGTVRSVTWSPDGSRTATAGADNTARIWDASRGAELLMLKGHRNLVTSVAWSPDGSRIATASWDDTTRVWEANTGAELIAFKGIAGSGKFASDYFSSVSWSPDGSRISTSGYKMIRIWDARSREELRAAGW